MILNGEGIKCDECKVSVIDTDMLDKHNAAYHAQENSDEEDMSSTYMSPYRFPKIDSQYICPIKNCTFDSDCPKSLRKHLVNDHDDLTLNPWGFSRDVLYREFLFLNETNTEEEMNSELVGKKRSHCEMMI